MADETPRICSPAGHVYVWLTSTMHPTTPEPPIGTRCACGMRTYLGGEIAETARD